MLSCQTCTVTCGFTSCYRVTGDGYDKQTCGSESCTLTNNVTKTIDTCTKDITAAPCSSGFCNIVSNSGCANTNLALTVCSSTPDQISVSCSNCVNETNCVKCAQTSINSASFQSCFGATCNDFITVTATVSSCPGGKDPNGNACTCCYSAQMSKASGLCTSFFPYFSSTEFTTYAKTKSSSPTFETTLGMGVLVLFALTLMSI